MASRLNPYLHFKDNARQAMEFYKSVFGGDLTLSTFGQGGMSTDQAEEDLIMHGQLESPNGFWLMGSDTPAHITFNPGTNITVSISGDDEAGLKANWDALSSGATIVQPLEKAPWGDSFGMLTDKFGIGWLVNISPAKG
jgi:PhnB protein